MTRLARLWQSISAFFRSGRTGKNVDGKFRYATVEDFPESLEESKVYVADAWGAALLCPCGCGDVIQLNLLKNVRPRWRVREHFDHSVSLTPSVWRRHGCRSHFFLRRGRIEWCHPITPNRVSPGDSASGMG